MDILCPKCGEPWDRDELHIESVSVKAFMREGCGVFGVKCEPSDRGTLAQAVYDVLGDDLDGAAAMFEDAEALGLFS